MHSRNELSGKAGAIQTAAALSNSTGVIGVAHGATLWSANISYQGVQGGNPVTLIDAAEAACAIDVARANGVRVVNMSFQVPSLQSLTDQINGGFNHDNMIFVGAAGNFDETSVRYPASLSSVIAVTATDSASNSQWPDANTGSALDLAAPGVNIYSTYLPGGTAGCSTLLSGTTAICTGTSMAAAHVSGAAALLAARYPSWTNAQIRDRLLATATDLGSSGFDNTYGNGLVNIAAAIQMYVAISGPAIAYSGISQMWSSTVTGGQTPYSYQWYVDGSPYGTSSSQSYTPGGSGFWIKVQVTDYYSLVAKDSMFVSITNCTPPEVTC